MAFFTSAQNFCDLISQSKKFESIQILRPQSPSFFVPRPHRLREAKRAMGTRMWKSNICQEKRSGIENVRRLFYASRVLRIFMFVIAAGF